MSLHSGRMSNLICPKCHGAMRTYERSNVTVDQCSECRGIFLDRGELERLIDAENAWADKVSAPPPAQPAPPPAQPAYDPRQDPRYDRRDDDYRGKPPKKRKSFLEDLFE